MKPATQTVRRPQPPEAQTSEASDHGVAKADIERAKKLFAQGRRAFSAGEYESALDKFQAAYDLSGKVALLYNIATTLDRLRRDEQTITALKRYLEAAPDAPEADEVKKRIVVLENQISARKAAEEEARKREEELRKRRRPFRLHPGVFFATARRGGAVFGNKFGNRYFDARS